MLSRVLLHVIATPFSVNHTTHLHTWRHNLRNSVPNVSVLVLEYFLHGYFERHSRFRLSRESSGVEGLTATGGIKGRSIQFQSPDRLIAVALEFLCIQHTGTEVVQKRIVVVEALRHELEIETSRQRAASSHQVRQYGPMIPPILRSAGFCAPAPFVSRVIPIACATTSMYLRPVPVLKITTSSLPFRNPLASSLS